MKNKPNHILNFDKYDSRYHGYFALIRKMISNYFINNVTKIIVLLSIWNDAPRNTY